MRLFTASTGAVVASLFLHQSLVSACDPLTESDCPADPALGTSVSADFTSGASSAFTSANNHITYDSNGVSLTVSESGDAPTLTSNWYIMFGRVEVVFKSAPGVGMVSSAILQSDDLDEIDWEILGAYPTQGQTNYFGKGETITYDREVTVADTTSQSDFNSYVIDWNAERIIWSLNGVSLRTLLVADADTNQYPQTPMRLKIGSWAGGDPSNPTGTIQWAGGEITYSDGPFSMVVQSVTATDYSTGTEYKYSGTSGNWQDIVAVGGSVNGDSTSGGDSTTSFAVVSQSTQSTSSPSLSTATSTIAAAVTSSSAYDGTHRDTTSSYVTPTVWPWVSRSTTLVTSSTAATATSSTYTSLATSDSASGSSTSTTVATVIYVTSSLPSSSAAASAGVDSSTLATSTVTSVATQSTAASATTSTDGALGDTASATSASMPAYTGAGSGSVVATKLGAGAGLLAGLVLLL